MVEFRGDRGGDTFLYRTHGTAGTYGRGRLGLDSSMAAIMAGGFFLESWRWDCCMYIHATDASEEEDRLR